MDKMRVLLLAPASSIHTVRWANGLVEAGLEVALATQHQHQEPIDDRVDIRRLRHSGVPGYFLNVFDFRRVLKDTRPDLVNVHYASGYGTTAQLAKATDFCPVLLSVWGSDVYDFPVKSPVHHLLAQKNLMAASAVASTSHAMAAQTHRIAPKLGNIAITPFGVDIGSFSSGQRTPKPIGAPIVVGTIKTLAPKYGIDTLIDAFSVLVNDKGAESNSIRLRIVGDGPDRAKLQARASALGLGHLVDFVGRVGHSQVPSELAKLDLYVALSRWDSESFGVAIIEASASGLPVVVSDAEGLREVVKQDETGFVVPRENAERAAEALMVLISSAPLRRAMGQAGQKLVQERYDWRQNVAHMVSVYENTIRIWQNGDRRKSKTGLR